MYQAFLSFRYLRARPINWIGVAGIFVAVSALILILSIMSGFLAESRGHLRGSLADLVVRPNLDRPLRQADGSLQPLERDAEGAVAATLASEYVAAASAHYTWFGMLAAPRREKMRSDPVYGELALVKMVGIDPAQEFRVSDLQEDLERESKLLLDQRVADPADPFGPIPGYEPEGRPLDPILVGEQLAGIWGLRRGRPFEIVTATVDPASGQPRDPVSRSFVLAGTFRSTNNDFDLQTVYLPREVLIDWFGAGREFTELSVRLHDYESQRDLARVDIAERLHAESYLHAAPDSATAEVFSWEDFQRSMLAAIENEKALMGIMLSLVLLVAAFTVFAILSMLVQEKRRDIGILAALGATPRGILGTFLMIGFWEALLGSGLGFGAGVWAAHKINEIEALLSDLFGFQIFNREVYLFDHIPTVIEPSAVGAIVLGAFFATLLAAALPAWRAARLNPVEALRHE